MIDPDALPAVPAVAELLGRKFAEAGFSLHLVGGAVRDQALGLGTDIEDLDLTTDAHPADSLSLLEPLATAIWRQGERFGTIGASVQDHAVEVTTYRRESYDSTSRKPEVGFGDDLETDLSRRDFTINAMARDAVTGTLVDPFNGWQDLGEGRLRTPLAPAVSFRDDPLRILRAARFGARLGMAFDPELVQAATDLSDRVTIVSGERIAIELERLLMLADPARGLRFLWETGVLAATFEGTPLAPFTDVEAAIEKIKLQSPADPAVRWAAFIWLMNRELHTIAQRLKLSREREHDLRQLLRTDLGTATDHPALRATLVKNGASFTQRLIGLQRIIGPTENPPLDQFENAFGELAQAVQAEDLSPPLTGDDVQRLLGIAPGPEVGAALRALQMQIVAVGPLSVDEATEFVLSTQLGDRQ